MFCVISCKNLFKIEEATCVLLQILQGNYQAVVIGGPHLSSVRTTLINHENLRGHQCVPLNCGICYH